VFDEHLVTFRLAAENIADNAYWYSAFNDYLLLGGPRTLRASVTFEY
jgi:iron complex outermembrane recepter protein